MSKLIILLLTPTLWYAILQEVKGGYENLDLPTTVIVYGFLALFCLVPLVKVIFGIAMIISALTTRYRNEDY